MDAWVGDLEALAEAAAQEGFSELVESPKLSIEQKREVLARILPALSTEGLNSGDTAGRQGPARRPRRARRP